MSEASGFAKPARENGGEAHGNGGGGAEGGSRLLTWLRKLRGRDATLRDTIEELIEEQAGEEEPSIAAHERALIVNVLELRDLTASDVMIPRADIVAIGVETELPQLLALNAERPHSRFPVYREQLDDVFGFIHIKDILACIARDQPFRIQDHIREVLIIAPSVPVLDLLLEMRQKRRHMAMVVDEYGGIDGLVTIENLIEEIVGEIEDEHETDTKLVFKTRADGTISADARVPVEWFEERVGEVLTEEEREDNDTLGGLVFSLAGRVPGRGELIRHPSGIEFEVVDADPRRIKRLRVRNLPPPRDPPPEKGG